MRLTGTALAAILVLLALVLPVALALGWHRLPGRLPRVLITVVSVLVCESVAVAAAGAVANDEFGFYNSWTDLLGTANQAPQAPQVNGLVAGDGSQGTVVTLSVAVPAPPGEQRSGRPLSVLVWLPPQYDQPQYRRTQFPVAVMLPGQPGTPQGVFHQFDFAAQATLAIQQHHVQPFVAVFPPIMIAPPRDTECTDVPHGPQAETWLFSSVRSAVVNRLRVTPNGRQWSALGWSTGGFCAAKLAVRHPSEFHAAVGFGAYYDAETDPTTGALFADRQQRNQNAPIWLAEHNRSRNIRLLIIVSRTDHASWDGIFYADSKAMIQATQGIPGVSTLVLPQGGHNYAVYSATVPQALSWLGVNAGL